MELGSFAPIPGRLATGVRTYFQGSVGAPLGPNAEHRAAPTSTKSRQYAEREFPFTGDALETDLDPHCNYEQELTFRGSNRLRTAVNRGTCDFRHIHLLGAIDVAGQGGGLRGAGEGCDHAVRRATTSPDPIAKCRH